MLETAVEVVLRSFTRYVVPGFVFVLSTVYLPVFAAGQVQQLQGMHLFDPFAAFVVAVVAGYLLDSLGAYRWNWRFRQYRRARRDLVWRLASVMGDGQGADPDQYLAELFVAHEQLYERLFVERAEWVNILNCSFALLSGALVTFGLSAYGLWYGRANYGELTVAVLLTLTSTITASKGIQRMEVHNGKVVAAVVVLAAQRRRSGQGLRWPRWPSP